MDISSLVNLSRSQQITAKAPADPIQKGLSTATSRLQAERSSTDVQVSAYGKTQAGFAALQTASTTLTKEAATPAETKKALQDMVSAYNEVRVAAGSTEPGAASNSANALRRTVSSDAMRSDLKTLGISQDKEGMMVLDSKVLDKAVSANPSAVKDAASRIGELTQTSASRELSEGSSLTTSLDTLNSRSQQLDARQTALREFAATQASTANTNTPAGIASYKKIFSM